MKSFRLNKLMGHGVRGAVPEAAPAPAARADRLAAPATAEIARRAGKATVAATGRRGGGGGGAAAAAADEEDDAAVGRAAHGKKRGQAASPKPKDTAKRKPAPVKSKAAQGKAAKGKATAAKKAPAKKAPARGRRQRDDSGSEEDYEDDSEYNSDDTNSFRAESTNPSSSSSDSYEPDQTSDEDEDDDDDDDDDGSVEDGDDYDEEDEKFRPRSLKTMNAAYARGQGKGKGKAAAVPAKGKDKGKDKVAAVPAKGRDGAQKAAAEPRAAGAGAGAAAGAAAAQPKSAEAPLAAAAAAAAPNKLDIRSIITETKKAPVVLHAGMEPAAMFAIRPNAPIGRVPHILLQSKEVPSRLAPQGIYSSRREGEVFELEYAVSNRGKCSQCDRSIQDGDLSWIVNHETIEDEPNRYFHFYCAHPSYKWSKRIAHISHKHQDMVRDRFML